jgi:NAD-dependent deacetylase
LKAIVEMTIEFSPDLILELKSAHHVAVLTGAGTSAESGVPTFRDAQSGLWAKYDPQELATPQAFRHNPGLVWDWYAWRRSLVAEAKPNAGHHALAQMAGFVPEFTLITQNVDGLHQQAGSLDVIELHGNIMRIKCANCDRTVDEFQETEDPPPHCPYCDGLLRPDVVWFGENLPQNSLSRALLAAHQCDLFLSIGTSSVVHPAASLPIEAMEMGTSTVEINPDRTPLTSYMTYVLARPSGIVLPQLVHAAWSD